MSENISFQEAYGEAVSEALTILGNIVSKIVTDYLRDEYSVEITKTYDNPDQLDNALEHAINGGKLIIERRIINSLYKKISLIENHSSIGNESFVQRVNTARKRYNKR